PHAHPPADVSQHDALERLVRSRSQRAGQAADLGAELGARRARGDMVLEQRALEAGQLAVQLERRPLARAIAFSVHGPHVTSDGGSVQKLVKQSAEIDPVKTLKEGVPPVEE